MAIKATKEGETIWVLNGYYPNPIDWERAVVSLHKEGWELEQAFDYGDHLARA
jgi:hypothetical protein